MSKILIQALRSFQSFSRVTQATIILTVILAIFSLSLRLMLPDQTPVVTGTIPNVEFGIAHDSKFVISFNQILKKTTRDNLTFNISPPVPAKTAWLENNYQYAITPTKLLTKSTQYTLTVLYKNRPIFSKQFLSSQFTLEEEAQHLKEQSEADIKFNQAIENLEKDFFWYRDIPIDNAEFTIVYDYDRKEFRIRLKIPETSQQERIQELTEKALAALKNVGVDPDEWGYYVLFLN